MAGTKEIKRRIKSIRNTKKITKAMELVAASKMKKAVSSTLASRLYAEYSWEILTSISENLEGLEHPLFSEREIKNILVVLITSNRGLCGAYNAQVIKKVLSILKDRRPEHQSAKINFITVGRKGDIAMRRIGQEVAATFDFADNITIQKILPLSKMLLQEYTSGSYDRVFVAYTDFISAISQKPRVKQVLPVSREKLKELIESLENLGKEDSQPHVRHVGKIEYLFEGDKHELLGSLAEKLTRMQIYQMLLESNASEQSARMMAMKNASDASGEMIEDLTLVFNKARQANITREISEISAGMASVS